MDKTKRIKPLEVFIELESKEVKPNKEYIAICQFVAVLEAKRRYFKGCDFIEIIS